MTRLAPFAAAAALALSGCVSQERMDTLPFQRQFTLAENYQAVYARANTQIRRCALGGDLFGDMNFNVDGQLYSELGYGEIQSGISSATYMPTTLVRIDRAGEGAQVSLKTTAYANIENTLNWLEYWSRGGQTCPVAFESPPAI